eukprot:6067942-Pleurochrysis_carterae.AAC.1
MNRHDGARWPTMPVSAVIGSLIGHCSAWDRPCYQRATVSHIVLSAMACRPGYTGILTVITQSIFGTRTTMSMTCKTLDCIERRHASSLRWHLPKMPRAPPRGGATQVKLWERPDADGSSLSDYDGPQV